MIAAEFKTDFAVVRIHDDCCGEIAEQRISRINHVVSASYKRRAMDQKDKMDALAVMQQTVRNDMV